MRLCPTPLRSSTTCVSLIRTCTSSPTRAWGEETSSLKNSASLTSRPTSAKYPSQYAVLPQCLHLSPVPPGEIPRNQADNDFWDTKHGQLVLHPRIRCGTCEVSGQCEGSNLNSIEAFRPFSPSNSSRLGLRDDLLQTMPHRISYSARS